MRYAETWDYEVTPSTFLQFDIAMGCSGTYSTLYGVMLEYSTTRGRHWSPVAEECLPPQTDCAGYHLSSMYMSDAHANWTRVTVYLPPGAMYEHIFVYSVECTLCIVSVLKMYLYDKIIQA